jgi:hypothetical protein
MEPTVEKFLFVTRHFKNLPVVFHFIIATASISTDWTKCRNFVNRTVTYVKQNNYFYCFQSKRIY